MHVVFTHIQSRVHPCISKILSIQAEDNTLQRWTMQGMSEDLLELRHTVCVKQALVVSSGEKQ